MPVAACALIRPKRTTARDADRPRSGTWLDYVAGTAWALGEAGLGLVVLTGANTTAVNFDG